MASCNISPYDLSMNFSWQEVEFKIFHISGSTHFGMKMEFVKRNFNFNTLFGLGQNTGEQYLSSFSGKSEELDSIMLHGMKYKKNSPELTK